MQRYLWLVMGLLLLVGGRGQAQTDADGLPYIYYYDDRQEAFVIERIDGTDTRLLGQGVADARRGDHYKIIQAGWSPSGQWLAWTAPDLMSHSNLGSPFIIAAATGDMLNLWETPANVAMQWSPVDDRLLVVKGIPLPEEQTEGNCYVEPSYAALTLEMWAVAGQIQLTSFEVLHTSDWLDAPDVRMQWTPDGEYAIAYYPVFYPDSEGERGYYYEFHTLDHVGGLVQTQRIFGRIITLSDDGRLVYSTHQGLTVVDLIAGASTTYDVSSDSWLNWQWSPNHQLALAWDNEHGVWLFDGNTLRSIGAAYRPPDFFNRQWTEPEVWSPDNRWVLFVDEVSETLNMVDATDGTISTLLHLNAILDVRWRWLDSSTVLVTDGTFRLVNLTGGEIATFPLSERYFTDFRLSPDRRYVAYIEAGPVIYDLQTRQPQYFSPSPDENETSLGGELSWDESGDWLLVADDVVYAGGGLDRSYGIIHRPTGDIRWLPTARTVQWLPTQVDIAPIPSVIIERPHPVQVLYGEDWAFYLSWSPYGNQLVGGLDHLHVGDLYLWTLGSGKHERWESNVDDQQQVAWNEVAIPTLVEVPQLPLEDTLWLATSPNVQIAVGATYYGWVAWDTVNETVLHSSALSHPWHSSASFSPDGRYLALGFRWHPAQIWDTTTWQVVGETPYAAQGVAFSPDGQYLAASGGWDVYIWRVQDLLGDS